MTNLTTVREALKYAFHLGVYSNLDWFTNLQYRAMKELDEVEGNGGVVAPPVVCAWHPGESECED